MVLSGLFLLFASIVAVLLGLLLARGLAPAGRLLARQRAAVRWSLPVILPFVGGILSMFLYELVDPAGPEFGPGYGIGGGISLILGFTGSLLLAALILLAGRSVWHASLPVITLATLAWFLGADELFRVSDSLGLTAPFRAPIIDPVGLGGPPEQTLWAGTKIVSTLIVGGVSAWTVKIAQVRP